MAAADREEAGEPRTSPSLRPPLGTGTLGAVVGPFTRTGSYYAQSWRDYLDGQQRELPVARPTLALAVHALRDEIVLLGLRRAGPAKLATVAQPVLIPGTMGTASYVLAGVPDNPASFSTAHGAGRVQSHQAARHTNPDALRRGLEQAGILLVRGSSRRGLVKEKPEAYKDIDAVIETRHPGRAQRRGRLAPG